MSILDQALTFFKNEEITGTVTSDYLDLNAQNNELGVNRHGGGYFNVHVNAQTAGSGTVSLVECDTFDGTYTPVANSSVTVAANAPAGSMYSLLMPKTKQFVKAVVSAGITAGEITAYIGPRIAQH